jgi:hypothetical protein
MMDLRIINEEELLGLKFAIINHFMEEGKNLSLDELNNYAKDYKTNFLYFDFENKIINIAWVYDEERILNDLVHEIIHEVIYNLEGKKASISYDNISDLIDGEKSNSIFKIIYKIKNN